MANSLTKAAVLGVAGLAAAGIVAPGKSRAQEATEPTKLEGVECRTPKSEPTALCGAAIEHTPLGGLHATGLGGLPKKQNFQYVVSGKLWNAACDAGVEGTGRLCNAEVAPDGLVVVAPKAAVVEKGAKAAPKAAALEIDATTGLPIPVDGNCRLATREERLRPKEFDPKRFGDGKLKLSMGWVNIKFKTAANEDGFLFMHARKSPVNLDGSVRYRYVYFCQKQAAPKITVTP